MSFNLKFFKFRLRNMLPVYPNSIPDFGITNLGFANVYEKFTKNVREKVTKCSLKTTEALLDADGHLLT